MDSEKVNQTKDATASESASEQKQETEDKSTESEADPTKKSAEEPKKDPTPPRQTIFDKYEAKRDEIDKRMEEKYPKVFNGVMYFREVWAETFPNQEKQLKSRMAIRKKLAKEQREAEEREKNMTPEELEEHEKSIPEWKKGALQVTDQGV